ncbi:MAG: nitrate reductase cytochrome c-type subunit [Burkholderiaceae bacterium]|nr:nitrate reductase cytochrome c-type subunit [Burkholderiaceae bacterium]
MKTPARSILALIAGVCAAALFGLHTADLARAADKPAATGASPAASAPAAGGAPGAKSAVKALRDTPVAAAEQPGEGAGFKAERDHAPLPRDFVQQPPLIPHTVAGYNITANFNKCMDCHAWSRARESGATKVSLTHFRDRDGKELTSVSPRRYFCLQCHVSQSDTKPLVANTFKPAEGLR